MTFFTNLRNDIKSAWEFICYCTYSIIHLKRTLELRKTNYGRILGWEVYLAEVKVAELLDPQSVEMFWDSYTLTHIHPLFKEEVKMQEFWDNSPLQFKSKAFDEFQPPPRTAIVIITNQLPEHQVYVRGLYLWK